MKLKIFRCSNCGKVGNWGESNICKFCINDNANGKTNFSRGEPKVTGRNKGKKG